MAIAESMRTIRLGKEEVVGEYRGADYFLKNTFSKISCKSTVGKSGEERVKDPAAPPKRVRLSHSVRREKQRLARARGGEKRTVPLPSGGGRRLAPSQAVENNRTRTRHAT